MNEEDDVRVEKSVDREAVSRFHEYNMRRGIEKIQEVKGFALRATGGR